MVDCGQYAEMLTRIITFAKKTNPDQKKKADRGETCCYVPVSEDYKNWTSEELTILATSPNGCMKFAYLSNMTVAALKRDSVAESAFAAANNGQVKMIFTEDALCAQDALKALTPTGNWVSLVQKVSNVVENNKTGIADAFYQRHANMVDAFMIIMEEKGIKTFDREQLKNFATSKKDVKYFDGLLDIVKGLDDKDPRIVKCSQQALEKLSPDGTWQSLCKEIEFVDFMTFNTRHPDKRTGSVHSAAKNIIGGSRLEMAEFDQQAALKLLDERGVKVESSHELQAPAHIRALAAVKGISKSVSVA